MNGPTCVIFRTAGGRQIGFGHFRRCLTLAGALEQVARDCLFLLHGDPLVVEQARDAGFPALLVGEMSGWAELDARIGRGCSVVFDSYDFSNKDYRRAMDKGAWVAVLDDRGDDEIEAHLLINGAAGAEGLGYTERPGRRCLLGPRYALLRSEFQSVTPRAVRQAVERLLILLGGSDPHRLTCPLVNALMQAVPDLQIDIVVGPLFDASVDGLPRAHQISLHRNPHRLQPLMTSVDLAICGGGQTTYELAAAGTPAIAICIAENQRMSLCNLAAASVVADAGDAGDPDVLSRVVRLVRELSGNPDRRARMQQQGRALVDGYGAARVAEWIVGLSRRSAA